MPIELLRELAATPSHLALLTRKGSPRCECWWRPACSWRSYHLLTRIAQRLCKRSLALAEPPSRRKDLRIPSRAIKNNACSVGPVHCTALNSYGWEHVDYGPRRKRTDASCVSPSR